MLENPFPPNDPLLKDIPAIAEEALAACDRLDALRRSHGPVIINQEKPEQEYPLNFEQTKKVNCTHAGNGERFVLWYGGKVRYCPAFEWFFVWNGAEGRWVKDDLILVNEVAKEVLRLLYIEAAQSADSEKRKELARWAMKCEAPEAINQMLTWAKSDPVVAVHFDVFDKDPMHLNLKNGWLDLRTLTLHPHSKEQYFSMLLPVAYDPKATCPLWLAFLDRIFRSHTHKELIISFLQRAIGYTLTGETKERAVFLLHGLGRNGKTVFINVLEALFGDYGATVASTTFTTAMTTNVRNDLAALKGKRFVWASENSTETVLDEELIKRVAGGDSIKCRFLFKEEFTYRPNFKIWWIFNHKPRIRDSTDSIWDRIHLVPCEERITDEEMDKHLTEKLIQELPGIFKWALEGLRDYQKRGGLFPPSQVIEATKDYRQSEDVLADFVSEMIEVSPGIQTTIDGLTKDTRTPFSEVWAAWQSFTTKNNEKVRTKQWLGRRLEERFQKYRSSNEKGFLGIRVKYSTPPP